MGEARLVQVWAFVLVGALALGCGSRALSPKPTPLPQAEPWAVATHNPMSTTPAWLSNGLIGLRIGRDGAGSGDTAFLIDEYDTEGEQKIVPLQNPFAITIRVEDVTLTPIGSSDYSQRLQFDTGALVTRWTTDRGVRVETETFIDPAQRVAAQRWHVKAPSRSSWRLSIPGLRLDRETVTTMAVSQRIRTQPGDTQETVAGSGFERNLDGVHTVEFSRVVRWPLGSASRAISRAQGGSPVPNDGGPLPSFEEVATRGKAFWTDPDSPDIEIEGPVTDQQAIRSFLFTLRSAVSPRGPMSVAPMALSSPLYNGHVFWDADLWVFPALLLVDPDRAAAISRYRMQLSNAAGRNFVEQARREGVPPVPAARECLRSRPPASDTRGSRA